MKWISYLFIICILFTGCDGSTVIVEKTIETEHGFYLGQKVKVSFIGHIKSIEEKSYKDSIEYRIVEEDEYGFEKERAFVSYESIEASD